jgi:hypothetical protein
MVKKILMVFLLFLSVLSLGFSASLMLDSFTTVPSVLKPGDDVQLTLRVKNVLNNNEEPIYSYVLELQPKNDLAKENIIIVDGTDNVGRLGANEYWNAKFEFKIQDGAPSGNYEFNVKIKKYDDTGNFISSTDASITLSVSGETFFVLKGTNETLNQGESKNFKISLENIGGANAGSVKVTLGNTEYVQVVGTNVFYFDKVSAGEVKNFDVMLHAADGIPTGTYNIPVTIEYVSGTTTKTQQFSYGILVGGSIDLKVANIETIPKEVRPGDNYVLLDVNLENAGEDAAKAVKAHLISSPFVASYSDDNLAYAGRIDAGTSKELKFFINVPKTIKPGVYELKLKVDYLNLMGKEFNKTLNVPFYVKEKPILEIQNVTAEGKAGSTMKVTFYVKNNGEEKAQEVDVRLIPDSSLPFSIEERSAYLGSIAPGESKKAVFNVYVKPDASFNTYKLRAFIRARGDSEVGDDNIYTYNKYVSIKVDGKAINKLLVGGVLIALLVLFGLIFRNKKKKSKKN